MKFSRNKKLIVIMLFIAVSFGIASFVLAQTSEFGAPGPGGESGAGVASPEAGVAARRGQTVPTLDAAKTSAGGAPVVQPGAQTGTDITRELGWLGAIIVNLASRVLSLVAGLVDWAVRFGNDVLTLVAVQTGWKIVLNFVNLGFVLAIIVIAFATIFQLQSYAMKQTLWKLIAAALLVNFSLVIAGGFISVSDNLSNVFLKSALGENGTNLSYALAGAFQPQKLAMVKNQEQGWGEWLLGWVTGETIQRYLMLLAGLFFVVVFTFLMILVFATLFVMLLVRAIALIFLLILSPLAWLFWIFPYTQQYWQKWWKEFLRWNFFAPIVMFFIYLTMLTAGGLREAKPLDSITAAESTYGSAAAAFTKTTMIGPEGGFFRYVTELLVLLALLFGGIYVANQFGIAGGGLAMDAAKGAGKWFSGAVGKAGVWAGRKTYEKTGGRFLGSEWMKKQTEKMAAGRGPIRWLGTGLNRLGMRSEKFVQDQYEELAKKLTPDRLNYEILGSRGAKRAALLKEAAKRKDIDMGKLAPVLNNPEEMAKIKTDFARGGLNFNDLQKAIGRSLKMIQAKTDEELREATDEFIKSLLPKDYASGQWNEIFKKTADERSQRIQKQLAGAFAEHTPGAYAKVIPHIKGENLDNFRSIIDTEIQLLKRHTDAEMKARGEKAENAFIKTMDRRSLYGEEAWVPPREGIT